MDKTLDGTADYDFDLCTLIPKTLWIIEVSQLDPVALSQCRLDSMPASRPLSLDFVMISRHSAGVILINDMRISY